MTGNNVGISTTPSRKHWPERRWDIDHAEAIMALEALYQTNLWDQYWGKALCGRD